MKPLTYAQAKQLQPLRRKVNEMEAEAKLLSTAFNVCPEHSDWIKSCPSCKMLKNAYRISDRLTVLAEDLERFLLNAENPPKEDTTHG